jgi:transcriptional regulator with XRE-family HTH domain
MVGRTLTPIAQLVGILENLPMLLREARRVRGLYLYEVAEQTGINISLICRIENGHDTYHMNQVVPLLKWLDRPAASVGESNGEVQPGIPGLHAEPEVGADTPDQTGERELAV